LLARRSDAELRIDIAAALESLPEPYREVVVRRDFEGLSIGELSQQLELTPAAVEGRLHRARELVREYLYAQ
jgi:RNA polymerase sigma factor (sigma-70 family)